MRVRKALNWGNWFMCSAYLRSEACCEFYATRSGEVTALFRQNRASTLCRQPVGVCKLDEWIRSLDDVAHGRTGRRPHPPVDPSAGQSLCLRGHGCPETHHRQADDFTVWRIRRLVFQAQDLRASHTDAAAPHLSSWSVRRTTGWKGCAPGYYHPHRRACR